jgi:hypothetical protein
MQLFSLLCKRLTGQPQTRRNQSMRFRPRLEALDDRLVPTTLKVTNNLDTGVAGDGSLRGEIAAAKNNDTIVFDPSMGGQTISLYSVIDNLLVVDGEMILNKNLTIQGPSAPLLPVTISGDGLSRIFEVSGAKTVVSLSNLNFTGGTGNSYPLNAGAPNGQGGAIWNGGTLTVNNCNLSNNAAISSLGLGGAIYNAGTLTLKNSTLDNNSVYRSDWDHNYGGNGGAIYNAGTLTVSNCILNDNTAYQGAWGGGYGGAIFNAYRATATITGTSFTGNVALADGGFDGGGGIYNNGTMTLSASSVSGSSVDGIFNDKRGHLLITSMSSVVNNYIDLYNLGVVKISNDSTVG